MGRTFAGSGKVIVQPHPVEPSSLGRRCRVADLWPARTEGLEQDVDAHLSNLEGAEVTAAQMISATETPGWCSRGGGSQCLPDSPHCSSIGASCGIGGTSDVRTGTPQRSSR